MIRGLRGATTISVDQPELIWEATAQLVQKMVKANEIAINEIASVTISTTPDVVSAFPAKAVRTLEGWQYVPIMCTHEMNVEGALPLCIRVLMLVNTTMDQKEVQHIYLNDAVSLRPDLVRERGE